jgi:hypothetical protein
MPTKSSSRLTVSLEIELEMCGILLIVHLGIVNDNRVYNMMRDADASNGVEVGCLTVYRLEVGIVLLFDADGVKIVYAFGISHQHV